MSSVSPFPQLILSDINNASPVADSFVFAVSFYFVSKVSLLNRIQRVSNVFN